MAWDVHSPECWAAGLGMAKTTLFGRSGENAAEGGSNTVFVDGRAASFVLCAHDSRELIFDRTPISWSWSSYLRHTLVLIGSNTELFLKSWDNPSEATKVRVPRSASEADELIGTIAKQRTPRTPNVVNRMMGVFKKLRGSLSAQQADNLCVVRAFNLLVDTMAQSGSEAIEGIETLEQLLNLTDTQDAVLSKYGKANLGDVVDAITHAAPMGIDPLNPHLLIRHASGSLYQEAHFELERQEYIQRTIFGYNSPNTTSRGSLPRDARFTPPELARTLIEQCLAHIDFKSRVISVLDPACGSGIFLQECLSELDSRNFSGTVRVNGFDSSPISVEIANYCVKHAKADVSPNLSVLIDIKEENALREETDWGSPSLVLMNPPFSSYKDMSREDRELGKTILGDIAVGHFDKAMAFIWRAISEASPGALIASVLPSSLLDSDHGKKWRTAIGDAVNLRTIGRFKGYSYFQDALVEPAFVVMEKLPEGTTADVPLTILESEVGSEDAAMRALRKGDDLSNEGVFLAFGCPPPVPAKGWMPKGYRNKELLAAIAGSSATVGKLFEVHQGVLTGNNNVFVIDAREYTELSPGEKAYFSQAIGTSTIWDGHAVPKEFVFYPFGDPSLHLSDEHDVSQSLPWFYKEKLLPARNNLLNRRGKDDGNWWTLTEYRAWQAQFPPKIVSAYFGASGKFTYDHDGYFVCVHGYSWLWRGGNDDAFHASNAPWAYIAVLNCSLFDVLLSCFCPRVQGGQFNLSKRFVRSVPLPDFIDGQVPGDLVSSLATIGKQFVNNQEVDHDRLAYLVARSYGVAIDRWQQEAEEN